MMLRLSRVWLEAKQLGWDRFALIDAILVLLAANIRPAPSNVTARSGLVQRLLLADVLEGKDCRVGLHKQIVVVMASHGRRRLQH